MGGLGGSLGRSVVLSAPFFPPSDGSVTLNSPPLFHIRQLDLFRGPLASGVTNPWSELRFFADLCKVAAHEVLSQQLVSFTATSLPAHSR